MNLLKLFAKIHSEKHIFIVLRVHSSTIFSKGL